jgi:hypothetical protein
MFVLDCLATVETRQRLNSSFKWDRHEGRALVGRSDDSRKYPKLEMFVVDCHAKAASRQKLYYIL